MSYHRYSQRRLRFDSPQQAPVAAARSPARSPAAYHSPAAAAASPRYMPSPRRRRYVESDSEDDDDDDDNTPIPFAMPPPRPLQECIMVIGRAYESCLSQECPITMDTLTDENAVTFICPAGGNRTAVLCFNMFALLYTLYRDINYFQRPPQLPTNRAPVSNSALQSLYRRVTLMLDDGYAEDPDHPDYEYASALRELISRAS